MDSKHQSLASNFDQFGGCDFNIQDSGNMKLKLGYEGIDQSIGSVKSLGLQEDEEVEDEEDPEDEDEDLDGGKGQGKRQGNEKKYLNPSAIVKENRAVEKSLKAYTELLSSKVAVLNEWLGFVRQLSLTDQNFFNAERALAQTRLHGLQFCLVDKSQSPPTEKEIAGSAMSAWIRGFTAPGNASSSASSGPPNAGRFLKAPPCQDYLDLKDLTAVKNVASGWEQCGTAEELKDFRNNFTQVMKPMQSLVKSANSSVTDFKNRNKTFEERKTEGNGTPAAKKRKVEVKLGGAQNSIPVLQAETSAITELARVHRAGLDDAAVDLNAPLVIIGSFAINDEVSGTKDVVKEFLDGFDKQYLKISKAARLTHDVIPTLRDAISLKWTEELGKCPGSGVIAGNPKFVQVQEVPAVHNDLSPCLFAITSHYETTSNEQGYAGALRVKHLGWKEIGLTQFLHFRNLYLRKHMVAPHNEHTIKDKDVCLYFRNATAAVIDEYADHVKVLNSQCAVVRGLVAVNDGLWTPPGWMFCELTQGTGNAGIKLGVASTKNMLVCAGICAAFQFKPLTVLNQLVKDSESKRL